MMRENMRANRRAAGITGLVLLSVLAVYLAVRCLAPAVMTAIASLQHLDLSHGLRQNQWLGIGQYRAMLAEEKFWEAVRSSLLLGILGGILPVLPGYFIGRAACSRKASWLLTGVLLLPVFLSGEFTGILLTSGRVWNSGLVPYWGWFMLAAVPQGMFFTAFLSAALGRMMAERGGSAREGALLGAGIALSLGLIFLLTPQRNLCQGIWDAGRRQMLNVLATFRPRSLMGDAVTPYSVLWNLELLLQLPGAAAGIALMAAVFRRLSHLGGETKQRERGEAGALLSASAAGLLFLAVLCLQLPFFHNSSVPEDMRALVGRSLLSAAAVPALALLLLPVGGWFCARCGNGWFIVLGLLLLSENYVGQIIFYRLIHLETSWLQCALSAVPLPLIPVLAAFSRARHSRREPFSAWFKQMGPVFLLFLGMIFTRCWSGLGGQYYFTPSEEATLFYSRWRNVQMVKDPAQNALLSLPVTLALILPVFAAAVLAVLAFGRLMDRRRESHSVEKK